MSISITINCINMLNPWRVSAIKIPAVQAMQETYAPLMYRVIDDPLMSTHG